MDAGSQQEMLIVSSLIQRPWEAPSTVTPDWSLFQVLLTTPTEVAEGGLLPQDFNNTSTQTSALQFFTHKSVIFSFWFVLVLCLVFPLYTY